MFVGAGFDNNILAARFISGFGGFDLYGSWTMCICISCLCFGMVLVGFNRIVAFDSDMRAVMVWCVRDAHGDHGLVSVGAKN